MSTAAERANRAAHHMAMAEALDLVARQLAPDVTTPWLTGPGDARAFGATHPDPGRLVQALVWVAAQEICARSAYEPGDIDDSGPVPVEWPKRRRLAAGMIADRDEYRFDSIVEHIEGSATA